MLLHYLCYYQYYIILTMGETVKQKHITQLCSWLFLSFFSFLLHFIVFWPNVLVLHPVIPSHDSQKKPVKTPQ